METESQPFPGAHVTQSEKGFVIKPWTFGLLTLWMFQSVRGKGVPALLRADGDSWWHYQHPHTQHNIYNIHYSPQRPGTVWQHLKFKYSKNPFTRAICKLHEYHFGHWIVGKDSSSDIVCYKDGYNLCLMVPFTSVLVLLDIDFFLHQFFINCLESQAQKFRSCLGHFSSHWNYILNFLLYIRLILIN